MPIVGTAGHVDHGKSTLVQALTGRDPDRWDEEKRRGLTIDLGFAWTDIRGRAVGFVDVPGHERFIKNMLAGVGGLDVALFVVAADEGWMPQSEEHLAVLDLLDTRHGVIALTRIDLAEPDIVELAELEITEQVEDTVLASWPIVKVAAPTGEGIDELRDRLATALDEAGDPRDIGRPRLWVDRAFVISGAGTVVTGTLVDGRLRRGDELALWPTETPVRVRTLQSHESEAESLDPGSRAAANLTGADRTDVTRGAMLGDPAHFRTSDTFLADLRSVRNIGESVTSRGAFQVHIGSGSWPAHVRLLEGRTLEAPGAAIIQLQTAIPLIQGDRLILRETGRRAVVAGGTILDPSPSDRRTTALRSGLPKLRATAADEPDARADALLETRGMASLADLDRDTGGGAPRHGRRGDGLAISEAAVGEACDAVVATVAAFHDANPLRPGMPKAAVASRSGLPPAVLEVVVAASDDLVDDGSTVRLTRFTGGWGDTQEEMFATARQLLTTDGLAVPRASALGLDQETLHAALRSERLTRIADDLAYLPEQLEEIVARLDELPASFTVAEFRDLFGVTRRHAVPLLEWLDRTGRTSRDGDFRSVRPRPARSSDDAPPR